MVRRPQRQSRTGAPWTEDEELRLLAIAHLPPRAMLRSWLACRSRLIYLRASGNGSETEQTQRSSGAR